MVVAAVPAKRDATAWVLISSFISVFANRYRFAVEYLSVVSSVFASPPLVVVHSFSTHVAICPTSTCC